MRTIIVSVDKAGHVNQCLAFCDGAGWTPQAIVRIPAAGRMTSGWDRMTLRIRRKLAIARAVPSRRDVDRIRIVASGHAAEKVVAGYRRIYGDDLFAIFSGRPDWPEPVFDVALMSHHALRDGETADGVTASGARATILGRGVLTQKVAGKGDGEGFAALIGGVNKAFDIDPTRISAQLTQMAAARPDAPLSIVFSRRTPPSVERAIRFDFAGTGARFIDRSDRAGYERTLREAGQFVVTPDSLTMICEVCTTGRPVYAFDLCCFDESVSTNRFLADFLERGYIAKAPYGAPGVCEPGLFDVPAMALELYDGWAWRVAEQARTARAEEPVPQAASYAPRTVAQSAEA